MAQMGVRQLAKIGKGMLRSQSESRGLGLFLLPKDQLGKVHMDVTKKKETKNHQSKMRKKRPCYESRLFLGQNANSRQKNHVHRMRKNKMEEIKR